MVHVNVRFSDKIAHGTIAQRQAYTSRINERLFKRMMNLFKLRKSYPIDVFETHCQRLLPEKKTFNIIPIPEKNLDKNFLAYLDILRVKKQTVKYDIFLPIKKDNIPQKILPTFMHEWTHFIDALMNPKYTLNEDLILNSPNIKIDKFNYLYERYFYHKETTKSLLHGIILYRTQKELMKFIEELPLKDKLIVLKNIKYNLSSEKLAYQEEFKFYNLLAKQIGKRPKTYDSSIEYIFDRKIDLVNRILYQVIKKERLNHSILIGEPQSIKDKIMNYLRMLQNFRF